MIHKRRYVSTLTLTAMAMPAAIYLLINNYIPLLGLSIAFKKINFKVGVFKSPWCGFSNFKFLFSSPDAARITWNTVSYNLVFIITGLIGAVFTAILLSEIGQTRWQKFYQTSYIVPYMVSATVVGYIVYAFLAPRLGLMDSLYERFGWKSVDWYVDARPWPVLLTFVNFWKNTGYAAILYLASITGFDRTLYEAASLDGATRWQRIKYITLPLLTPLMITLTLLNVGRIFYSDFGLFYQIPLASGMLQKTTDVIDTYVYRMLIVSGDIGKSSAAGFYQSVVGAVMIVIFNMIARKFSPENALF